MDREAAEKEAEAERVAEAKEKADNATKDADLDMTGAAIVAAENLKDQTNNSDEATKSENKPQQEEEKKTSVTVTVKDDGFLQVEATQSGASSLAATAVAFLAASLII